jgi:putative transposase
MSLNALRKGTFVLIGSARFVILKKLDLDRWQLENASTGEWCVFTEHELLDRFANNELVFINNDAKDGGARADRALGSYSPDLIAAAEKRLQYLKEIDRHQPIALTGNGLESLVSRIAERIGEARAPSCRTLSRDYRKWLAAGRDIRAVIPRHTDRGGRGSQMLPEVTAIADAVIEELYMTPERKRVPEIHFEIVRRLADANSLRSPTDQLSIPSRRTVYREIARRPLFEVVAARYGKRHAEMKFRTSGAGPEAVRALQRVSMDHTPGDLVVVDDNTMLPLGRPTITSALDEFTRCPMGFYSGFEPPSCLSVMRCLKHAILPKTYLSREFPAVKNAWECYGVPELVVVDNPPEFHSTHFERACLQIGADIQYAKVLVPWYKGKLERFQGTMNHDLMHGNPGTTFSNILERDDYDPSRHAVVLLSTFREMLHKWIIDVYLQTPHRGINDTPAHRWHSEMISLPPPLPPSAGELDVVLGMTVQRVVFHYGIELEGLKYNGPELGELRRRMGVGAKVELTFDPGDLGHVNVLDPQKDTYIRVPAVDGGYSKGLSFWQNKVIRRYAQRQLDARTDIVALAQAKAEIRALVERDFNRKSTRGRKRHARFMEDHSARTTSDVVSVEIVGDGTTDCRETEPHPADNIGEHPKPAAEVVSTAEPPAIRRNVLVDDEILPVFEADLDLPHLSAAVISTAAMEENR